MTFRFLILFLCCSSILFSQEGYNISGINEELLLNAHSVVRNKEVVIDISSQDKLTFKKHIALTVLNKQGNAHIERFVNYDNSSKIRKLNALLFDKNGRIIKKFKKNDFIDANAIESGTLYSDNRIKIMPSYEKEYPYTLVLDYEVENKNTAFIPTWYLHANTHSSIESSSYTINYNPSLGFRYKVHDRNNELDIKDENNSFSVKVSNVKIFESEAYGPPMYELLPNIKFALKKFILEGLEGEATSWKDFGKWEYDHLIHGLDDLPKATVAKISQLVEDAENIKEKVRRIYKYVQDNTRYISVQLGIGGLRPYSASEVDRLGYGDCKGLSNYTKALLKSQGIRSFYAEVWAGDDKRNIDNDFTSIQGNHVILNVPLENEEVWLECTSQTMPFNFLGDFTDDRDVLLLTPEGGIIKRTPKYTSELNKTLTKAEFSVDAEGTLEAAVEINSTGISYEHRYGLLQLDTKDKKLFYQKHWNYLSNLRLEDIQYENDSESIRFKEKLKLSARRYANKAGNKMYIALNPFQRQKNRLPLNNARKQPLVMSRSYAFEDSYTIKIPEGYKIEFLPKPIDHTTIFGSYKIHVDKISDDELLYQRQLILNEGTFEASEYSNFRNFMRALNRGDNQKMIIEKTDE